MFQSPPTRSNQCHFPHPSLHPPRRWRSRPMAPLQNRLGDEIPELALHGARGLWRQEASEVLGTAWWYVPRWSMVLVYESLQNWVIYKVNVGKYSIHGSSGNVLRYFSCKLAIIQETQEPKLEIPTTYKTYVRHMFLGISLQNMALYGAVTPFWDPEISVEQI